MQQQTVIILGKFSGLRHELSQQLGTVEHELKKQYAKVINPLNLLFTFHHDWKPKLVSNLLSKDVMQSDVICLVDGYENDSIAIHLFEFAKKQNKKYFFYQSPKKNK
jgi:hypothetical protein